MSSFYKLKDRCQSGFSLIEVVVALFIGSVVMYSLFEVIGSTKISTQLFSDRFFARNIATNQLLLLKYVDKPDTSVVLKGTTLMNSQLWDYEQHIVLLDDTKFECRILVKQQGDSNWIYEKKSFVYKQRGFSQ